MCDHAFQYQGIGYEDGRDRRPGSGSVTRYYAHAYFCSKCLEQRYTQISETTSSYEPIKFGATPQKGLASEYDRP